MKGSLPRLQGVKLLVGWVDMFDPLSEKQHIRV